MGSFMQDIRWAQVKNEWDVVYLGYVKDEQLKVAASVYIRKVAKFLTFGYIPKGPLYQDITDLQAFLKELTRYSKKQGWIAVKFDLNVYETLPLDKLETLSMYHQALIHQVSSNKIQHINHQFGLTRSIQPQVQLALNPAHYQTPKALLSKVNKAKSVSMQLEFKGIEALDAYMGFIERTNQRKHIFLRDKAYFKRLLTAYKEDAKLVFATVDSSDVKAMINHQLQEVKDKLLHAKPNQLKHLNNQHEVLINQATLLARFNGKIDLGALCMVVSHQSCELLYSGFDERFKFLFAPVFLRDQVIKWAKEQHLSLFNFGGVVADKNDGLFQFKASFQPDIHFYVGEFELAPFIFSKAVLNLEPMIRRMRFALAFFKRGMSKS